MMAGVWEGMREGQSAPRGEPDREKSDPSCFVPVFLRVAP